MRPTLAQIQAALSVLPDGFAALGATVIAAPGLTSDALLIFADGLDRGAAQRRSLFIGGDAESRAMASLATIMRDAASTFAEHPPRVPASADHADAAIRRYASAAGLSTAGGAP